MLTYNKVRAPTGTMELRPGPLRLSLDNRTDVRVLPSVWIAGDLLHDLLGKRKPFLTANRLLSNQTFRDIYRTDTLDVDQGLKITSLTFLFTDLKGSTGLYERVGDLWRMTWCARTFVSCMRSWRRRRAPWSRRSAMP
jgi:class 3 adenylate cyclase